QAGWTVGEPPVAGTARDRARIRQSAGTPRARRELRRAGAGRHQGRVNRMSITSRIDHTFTRRALFGTALAAGAAALPGPSLRVQAAARDRQDRLDAARPLTIRSVEAFVIRNPPKPVAPDEPLELPPAGTLTGGVGIWN